jgi:hypothetical protein
MRSVPLLAVLALASTACSEAGPTGSNPASPGSAASVADAPATSGPLVVRFEGGYPITVTFDLADGLLAVFIARDGFAGCGEAFTIFRPAQYQEVSNPVVQDLMNELFRTEAFVTVYPWEGEDIEVDPCGFLLNTPKVGRGTAQVVRTDNNVVGAEAQRANAFGYTAEGTLTLTGGGEAHFSVFFRSVVTSSGVVRADQDINLALLQ